MDRDVIHGTVATMASEAWRHFRTAAKSFLNSMPVFRQKRDGGGYGIRPGGTPGGIKAAAEDVCRTWAELEWNLDGDFDGTEAQRERVCRVVDSIRKNANLLLHVTNIVDTAYVVVRDDLVRDLSELQSSDRAVPTGIHDNGSKPPNAKQMAELNRAVKQAGRKSSPKRLRNFVGKMRNETFCNGLRILQSQGKYDGFSRRKKN